MPPRLETLDSWLERAHLAAPVESRAARSAGLYRLLKQRGWYGGDPPWETVRALLALVDELEPAPARRGRCRRAAQLNRAIELHYRAAAARVAGAEAQLVLEVWRAYAKPAPGAPLDPGLARRLRQQAWISGDSRRRALRMRPRAASYWLTSGIEGAPCRRRNSPSPQALAAHVPVRLIAPQSLAPLLAPAWQAGWRRACRARANAAARAVRGRIAGSPCAAHSLEQEAALAAAQVLQWLAAGKRRIAIVAFDRLTARRMRALLERRRILLADESGWKLSTTSAATCAMRWVEVATGGFLQRDVLDWLKSPHVFASLPAAMREARRRLPGGGDPREQCARRPAGDAQGAAQPAVARAKRTRDEGANARTRCTACLSAWMPRRGPGAAARRHAWPSGARC